METKRLVKREMTDAETSQLPRFMQDYTPEQQELVVCHYMTYSLAKLRKFQDLTNQQIAMKKTLLHSDHNWDDAKLSLMVQADLLAQAVGERYCPMP